MLSAGISTYATGIELLGAVMTFKQPVRTTTTTSELPIIERSYVSSTQEPPVYTGEAEHILSIGSTGTASYAYGTPPWVEVTKESRPGKGIIEENTIVYKRGFSEEKTLTIARVISQIALKKKHLVSI
jgi:hypothetical protein